MNKKWLVLIAVVLVLLVVSVYACQRRTDDEPVSVPTEIEETIPETIPGVVNMEDPIENPYENTSEATEAPATSKDEDPTSPTGDREDNPTVPSATESVTEPTVPSATENVADPTVPIATENITEPTRGEDSEATAPSAGGNEPVVSDYEKYQAMSGAAQKEFMDSFGSVEAFFAWLDAAKAEHEALHPEIDVGDGNINLGA